MVVVNPNLYYGLFEAHIFCKPHFIVTPSIHQLTCLFQNRCMKLYDGYQHFFTQLLELLMDFCTCVNEYFGWSAKT
jgi:hypothetical protein